MAVPDDNKWWIDILYGVIATLWVALGGAWAYVWKEVAMKRWVKDEISAHAEADEAHDRQLFKDLVAPLAGKIEATERLSDQRHLENRALLEEILRTIKHHGN